MGLRPIVDRYGSTTQRVVSVRHEAILALRVEGGGERPLAWAEPAGLELSRVSAVIQSGAREASIRYVVLAQYEYLYLSRTRTSTV